MTQTHFKNPIFAGLDTNDRAEAEQLAIALAPEIGGLKIGLEFFYAFGREGYQAVAATGAPIFLDLKLHDIPNTVAGGIRSACTLNPAIINVHASGGAAMMKAAADAAAEADMPPMVIAVTVLTSLDDADLHAQGISGSAADQVLRLANSAQKAGLHGVVCSPKEISLLRRECGPDFKLIVPGIRPAGADIGDQKRVMTPEQALGEGADILVISRPIIRADNPALAARAITQTLAAPV
ncbi:MAG: orotidine-5'-phosphate decarboxylase [Rhodobiaceae bacterium]|nr:orotidine-5'-phosphate decarboxylase [Rhodobiaceae bacterium]